MKKPHDRKDHIGTLAIVDSGLFGWLTSMHAKGAIATEYYENASKNCRRFIHEWLTTDHLDRLSPNLRGALVNAVGVAEKSGNWENIANAFSRRTTFGTGGIRALMGFDKESIVRLDRDGLDASILKGENTINNVVLMRAAHCLGAWALEEAGPGGARIVVGCDSRIRGLDLAQVIAEVLLNLGVNVCLFDQPVPYPEVTFAVPELKADLGIFISASHNDYRYNGFKLSGRNGAQIRMRDKDEVVRRIDSCSLMDIERIPLDDLYSGRSHVLERLCFLGGTRPLDGRCYWGRESTLIDVHTQYLEQVRKFILISDVLEKANLGVIFAAYNGAGRKLVPSLLEGLGAKRVFSIPALDEMDGFFPAFKSSPGEEQQPDPGDPRAAKIALSALRDAPAGVIGRMSWEDADILVGTDPDADRCGVIVKPPEELQELLSKQLSPRYSVSHVQLPADDMWTLLLWYRLANGVVKDSERSFIALSHTTSDSLVKVAQKHGLGVVKTWVGFAWLSTAVSDAWAGRIPMGIVEGRTGTEQVGRCHLVYHDTRHINRGHVFNVAAMEQSNGFSILGGPPQDDRSLGLHGHVMDKDGTLAALLTSEVAAYAKLNGTSIMELLVEKIYSDPDIGLFVNYYEPDPLDGEYPGLEGDTKKKSILDRVDELLEAANTGSGVKFGDRRIVRAVKYWTGKYDAVNGRDGFPDEGIRFYFDSEASLDYVTIRPSGTTNSLRFHVQLYGGPQPRWEAWNRRFELEDYARRVVHEIREIVGAPRGNEQY